MKISEHCYLAVFEKVVVALDIRRSAYFLYDGRYADLISSVFVDGESPANEQLINQLVFDEIVSLSGGCGGNSGVADFRGTRFRRFDGGRWSSRNLSVSQDEKLSARALVLLVVSALRLRLYGAGCMRGLHPVARQAKAGFAQAVSSRIAERYHKAAVWCPLRITCIQMSLAIVLELRRHGCAAQIVIGVRPYPFVAHAWVEVEGRVYGDEQDLRSCYAVIYRSQA
jgi:hypothetical protein